MITINHMNFELVENYRDAFDEAQFIEKYSEVLNKYDYIVGDIGYEKLRLAGFYRDNKKKVERDKKFSAIQDYLYEYCNFGCAYFVVRKVTKEELKKMSEESDLEVIVEEEVTVTHAEKVEIEIEAPEKTQEEHVRLHTDKTFAALIKDKE